MSEETKKTDLKWHEFHQRKYPIYVQWGVQSNSKLEELRDEQARAENKGMCCLDGRKNRMTKEEDLFDLAGYGSLQFPENNIFCLAGFSAKIFDMMKLLEQDRNELIKKIDKVEL